ncbi:class I SAM-dependent methyltransferase [Candidatus Uhrbacteria bacterium]|nr:class I SAM-dependent methyltransferase [Candidatus Uhrbacteria bacterium]
MSEERSASARKTEGALEGYEEFVAVLERARVGRREQRFLGNPQAILDRLIATTSEEVAVYSAEAMRALPKEGPSDMELYLLGRIGDVSDFVGAKKREGGLRVMESIRCLRDRIRTKAFLRGVGEAVATLDDGRDIIRVCDAGCGAIPVQAIYAALASPRVRATCIEINAYSAAIARSVVASFGLQDRMTIVQDDATTFSCDGQFDLLVSETMHAALTSEPMVQIMSHLRSSMAPGGIMLPSMITVRAAVMRASEYERPSGYVRIYDDPQYYVQPDWQTIVTYRPGDALSIIDFTLPLPETPYDYVVLLNSEVDIGRQHLAPYQSLITTPQALREPDSDLKSFRANAGDVPARVHVRYAPGDLLEDVRSRVE